MNDSLLDDVKALLDKDFGDDRILKQICRACENDEVISNYERNYVKKLAEKHLGRRPEVVQTSTPDEEKPIIPDVVIPEPSTIQNIQTFQPPPRISSSTSKNSKLMLGIGGVALVIIIAVAASFSGVSDVTYTTGIVNLSIENKNNELVWAEQVSLKSNGKYSTLAIAGGPGWESSGTYTINIDNGIETKSNTFSFTA
jgi:uncharacterized protein (UPF0333 family)